MLISQLLYGVLRDGCKLPVTLAGNDYEIIGDDRQRRDIQQNDVRGHNLCRQVYDSVCQLQGFQSVPPMDGMCVPLFGAQIER